MHLMQLFVTTLAFLQKDQNKNIYSQPQRRQYEEFPKQSWSINTFSNKQQETISPYKIKMETILQ